ncbi:MAG: anti-sigma F factor antagonist [Anaerovoracaceae bacterium]
MDTTFYLKGNTLIACLSGEIDHHIAEKIRNDIDDEIRLYGTKNLILDFSKVTFMDSSGVGVVLGRYKKLKEIGGKVTVRNAGRLVKQILELSGVFSLMDYEETEGDNGK